MTDKQRLKESKRIRKHYGQKRKAEKNGCSCYVCKYFDELNGRCLKPRKNNEFNGTWT